MLPYSAAMAMDYVGYHHQRIPGAPTAMGMLGTGPVGNGGGGSTFTHSWLVPPQDLYSAVSYNQFSSNQPAIHKPQPIIDPRHV